MRVRMRVALSLAPLLVSMAGSPTVATSATAWRWRLAYPAPPPARTGSSMVYDEATGQVVLFTASACVLSQCAETWIWDGDTWSKAKVDNPPARTNAAMVYDAASRKVLLFGGSGSSGALGDTWLWDGKKWSAFTTGTQPPARSNAGIVYATAWRKAVLFGGSNTGSGPGDTWLWTGGEGWAQLTQPPADPVPPGRNDPGLAFDAARQQVVLFGGTGADSGANIDATTWVLPSSGKGWVAAATNGPAPRHEAGMVYDGAHRQVLMVGGYGSAVGAETWIWDGKRWTEAKAHLTPRFDPALVADPACGCVVLLAGREGAGVPMTDSWRWDGASWHALAPNPDAYWSGESTIAYDGKTKQVVVFGGVADTNDTFVLGETWIWDHHRGWAVATKNGPPRSPRWRVAYDSARRLLVVFENEFQGYNETWLWDGHTWTLAADTAPYTGFLPQDILYTYDVAARQLVTYFGRSGTPPPTYTMPWNGRRWSSSTGTQPPWAPGASLAYDETSRRAVLLNGGGNCRSSGVVGTGTGPDLDNGTAPCATTWTWDGSRWSQHSGSAPPGRTYGLMAYDAAHHNLVLFGGIGAGHVAGKEVHEATFNYNPPTEPLNDTWLWNGSGWTKANPAHKPPSVDFGGTLVYDPALRRVVLYGAPADRGLDPTGVKVAPQVDRNSSSGTWMWDGKDWTDATTSNGPAGTGTLVYDKAFGHLLVFGTNRCPAKTGLYGTGYGPDYQAYQPCGVWYWDGHAWRQPPGGGGIATPDASAGYYAYDEATRQVVTVTNDGVWTWGSR